MKIGLNKDHKLLLILDIFSSRYSSVYIDLDFFLLVID